MHVASAAIRRPDHRAPSDRHSGSPAARSSGSLIGTLAVLWIINQDQVRPDRPPLRVNVRESSDGSRQSGHVQDRSTPFVVRPRHSRQDQSLALPDDPGPLAFIQLSYSASALGLKPVDRVALSRPVSPEKGVIFHSALSRAKVCFSQGFVGGHDHHEPPTACQNRPEGGTLGQAGLAPPSRHGQPVLASSRHGGLKAIDDGYVIIRPCQVNVCGK